MFHVVFFNMLLMMHQILWMLILSVQRVCFYIFILVSQQWVTTRGTQEDTKGSVFVNPGVWTDHSQMCPTQSAKIVVISWTCPLEHLQCTWTQSGIRQNTLLYIIGGGLRGCDSHCITFTLYKHSTLHHDKNSGESSSKKTCRLLHADIQI